jgi:hypothetical protein
MTLALALILAVISVTAEAGTHCRSSRTGSTVYTTCEGGSVTTRCRTHKVGSTVYTSCN